MNKLHNCISSKLFKKSLGERFNVSFYKYFLIQSPKEFRNWMYIQFYKLNIYGRIYVSFEGVNAQISVPIYNFNKMKKILHSLFKNNNIIFINKSINNEYSFWVLIIKVKKKILSDGLKNFYFNNYLSKFYLKADVVNKFITQKNVLIIDLRNSYEYAIGHFNKAFTVPAYTFREQLQKIIYMFQYAKNDQILIYCTGGIRCEKASLWMRYHGYRYVYQIKGGIIKYIYDTKKNNLPIFFKGSNFVFDNRLSENITKNLQSYCWKCYNLCDRYINCKNNFCHKLFIQCNICLDIFKGYCSSECRKIKDKNIN
ncbi:rhodanese-related sulfurtransferase [Buchnera aphidicola (Mollitrichosiphum nigrofasciatum)]|uniref:oxygen-dependent tRNA uridine(34) hydroxylase TrhO n=1 Tax=Buchnera aphidicola TaxID=9 RepID=UPI0031B81C0E